MNDFAARFGPWAVVTGASSVSRESRKRPPALYVLLFRVKRPTDPQPTPAPRPEANGRAGHAAGAGKLSLVLANGTPA